MQKKCFSKLCICVLFFICLANPCDAIDLDKPFAQKITASMLDELKNLPDQERAVFIEFDSSPETFPLYLRFNPSSKAFILRGNLPEKIDQFIKRPIGATAKGLFAGLKANGEALYEYGTAFFSAHNIDRKQLVKIKYVAHFVGGIANACFVCDLGYLEAYFPVNVQNMGKSINKVLKAISGKHLQLAKTVPLNRYYLFKDNYFGQVHLFTSNSLMESRNLSVFFPVHKLTMNKAVAKWKEKDKLDRELLLNILAQKEYLLAQDLRLKLAMVPAKIKLNWDRIDHSDLGSGQNQVVFLSSGAGINYFDDPWRSERTNLPCPRLIFDKSVYAKDKIQLFPTFSIEPAATGEGRLQQINNFQLHGSSQASYQSREPLWLPVAERKTQIETIEKGLCEYGLVNDSPNLRPGFELYGKHFNGNVVNNEIRVFEAISLRALLTAVIVPPRSANAYKGAYIEAFRNSSPHWQYNCATNFTELFCEASTPDDKGFRIAWLKWHLNFSHPTLFRMLEMSRHAISPNLENTFAEKISAQIKLEGPQFFRTKYAQHRMKLEAEKMELWCNYLEAYREKQKNAGTRLAQFVDYLRELN